MPLLFTSEGQCFNFSTTYRSPIRTPQKLGFETEFRRLGTDNSHFTTARAFLAIVILPIMNDRYFVLLKHYRSSLRSLKGTAQLQQSEVMRYLSVLELIRSVIQWTTTVDFDHHSNSTAARPTRERVLHILEGCPIWKCFICAPFTCPATSQWHMQHRHPYHARLWNIHLVGNGDACFLGDISTPF